MITLYVAKFTSPDYPEDNTTFGAYLTSDAAEARIEAEHAYALGQDTRFKHLYQKKKHCYTVDDLELFCTKEELFQFLIKA